MKMHSDEYLFFLHINYSQNAKFQWAQKEVTQYENAQ